MPCRCAQSAVVRALSGTSAVRFTTVRPLSALVHRYVHREVPLKTEYSLTNFGWELSEAPAPLSAWGHRRLEKLTASSAV